MPFCTAFYQKQALIVHAVHTPYRERSHFDGQDVLESGLGRRPDRRRLAQPRTGALALRRQASPRGLAVGRYCCW
jgi:uncharacterized protein (DUF1501 family)